MKIVNIKKDSKYLKEYKGKELVIKSPCLLKLVFKEKELIELERIQ